jgi:hypothetical protein
VLLEEDELGFLPRADVRVQLSTRATGRGKRRRRRRLVDIVFDGAGDLVEVIVDDDGAAQPPSPAAPKG